MFPCFSPQLWPLRIMRVCAALTYVMVSMRRGGGGGGAVKQEGEKRRGER